MQQQHFQQCDLATVVHTIVTYLSCTQKQPYAQHVGVLQDILDSGTQSDLLAAAQLLKSYNGALQNQVSRHQHAAHILQVLLKEQVTLFFSVGLILSISPLRAMIILFQLWHLSRSSCFSKPHEPLH